MITVTRLAIHKEGNNVICDESINVILRNDGAGYYLNIIDGMDGSVLIDFDQVEELFKAINILKKSIDI